MKIIKKKLLHYLVTVAFIVFSMASPAHSFSIGEEREFGDKLLYSVRSSFHLLDDPDITQYINNLGSSVLEVAGIQYFDYHFFVIDSKDFNAFAAPSGLIFFHSGLIASMNSENELVSVMAHEIGHIVKRHLASRVEKGAYSSAASLGLALAAIAFGGAAAPALLTGALAAGQSVNLHFSRQHEEEADLLAYSWMKKLHRNPEGQATMLESMRRIARYRSDILPQYLLTHPNPEARMNYIESLIDLDREEIAEESEAVDDFEFIRFKYRILSQVKESQSFKIYLANIIADARATEFKKAMAQYGISQIALHENSYDRSLESLEQVIQYFPTKNILLTDRGIIEFAAGRYQEAEKDFRDALKIDQYDMYATRALGQLLYQKGDLNQAIKYFSAITHELPEYSKVYFDLGKIYSDQDQQGLSSFYLGKYNLYEGRLLLATQSFKAAMRDKTLSEETKKDAQFYLKKIEQLEKGS